jgi:hypothetical protein
MKMGTIASPWHYDDGVVVPRRRKNWARLTSNQALQSTLDLKPS